MAPYYARVVSEALLTDARTNRLKGGEPKGGEPKAGALRSKVYTPKKMDGCSLLGQTFITHTHTHTHINTNTNTNTHIHTNTNTIQLIH